MLYLAGMVWNDYFDFEEDRRDRPARPLPSGQIARGTAARIGVLLLAVGVGAAACSGFTGDDWRPDALFVGGILTVAIAASDARIKRTAAGPLGMAACRFLNVLLGMTLVDAATLSCSTRVHLASMVGLYIVGVTWFARTEEKRSDPKSLRSAAVVLLVSLLLTLTVPIRVPAGTSSDLFPFLVVAFGFWIGIPVVRAIHKPTPAHVQAGVKRCILGLVALDALLASVFVGSGGLLILLLLPPALWLGKWVYST